jgi:hypothetical protein
MYDNDSKEPVGKSISNFIFFQLGASLQEKGKKKKLKTSRYARLGKKDEGKYSYFSNFKMDLHRSNELKAKNIFLIF